MKRLLRAVWAFFVGVPRKASALASARVPWPRRLDALISRQDYGAQEYAVANCEAVKLALCGLDPFGSSSDESAGARMVVNVSSAHIPAFCDAAARGDSRPYKNCYDLALV